MDVHWGGAGCCGSICGMEGENSTCFATFAVCTGSSFVGNVDGDVYAFKSICTWDLGVEYRVDYVPSNVYVTNKLMDISLSYSCGTVVGFRMLVKWRIVGEPILGRLALRLPTFFFVCNRIKKKTLSKAFNYVDDAKQ